MMTSLPLFAGSVSVPRGRRAAFRPFSETALLRLGTALVSVAFVGTLVLFFWFEKQDAELAAHGIHIEQLTGEARE